MENTTKPRKETRGNEKDKKVKQNQRYYSHDL
jgi:hypothetical protein